LSSASVGPRTTHHPWRGDVLGAGPTRPKKLTNRYRRVRLQTNPTKLGSISEWGAEEGWIQTGALTVNCEGVGGGAVALLVRGAGAAGIEGGLLLLLLRLERRLAHVAVMAARVPEVLQGDTQRQQREL
jgi:hypothetical protein